MGKGRSTVMRTERRARKRRKKSKRRGFRIRPLPLSLAVGAVAVVGLVSYLIVQSGPPAGSGGDDAAAEANDDPALPGEFVDLPEIYGGAYPDSAGHVSTSVDYARDGNTNPPVGGPHWSGQCGEDPDDAPTFCGPAPWGMYRAEWEAATLVHNMEHGGVIVWYNTRDQSIIDSLEDVVRSQLEDGKLVVVAPYSDMAEETIAVTSWSRIDKISVAEYDGERVTKFIQAHERRFNPEHF